MCRHPSPSAWEPSGSRSRDERSGANVDLAPTGERRLQDYVAALGGATDPTRLLQAFRYEMPPHGGFALGLERWAAGARNIRETTLFPPDVNRLVP